VTAVTVTIDPEHDRGPIDRRLAGTFVEHLGRGVYTGLFEPEHPRADGHGFRADVAELVDELGPTLVRYPGGNFVSGYRWEDGIGPLPERPRRLDLAWRAIEPNTVGTDEFLGWAARRHLEPMLAVNLGTRGVRAAADLVEYCNVPGGTAWSDRRRANGAPDPYRVRLWCLGNEMDGPWQIGHTDAASYGALAAAAGRAMRAVDPEIELVACGSSSHDMATFGAWETTVLERTYDVVDYVSLHAYYEEHDGDRRSFLASGAAMHAQIRDVIAVADAVGARRRDAKRLRLSFDEWNVWYLSRTADPGSPPATPAEPANAARPADVAEPRLEDAYSALDAVVVGDLLITLLNNADRVAIACQAQLVNVIAPIRTDPGGAAWRQTTFHPVAAAFRLIGAGAVGLVTDVDGPTVATRRHGEVPAVSAAAARDNAGGIRVFLVNRGDRPVELELRHPDHLAAAGAVTLAADDSGPRDRPESATAVTPVALAVVVDERGTRLRLPAESWSAVSLTPTA
jgi:alpha-L-arabinofuranosidase